MGAATPRARGAHRQLRSAGLRSFSADDDGQYSRSPLSRRPDLRPIPDGCVGDRLIAMTRRLAIRTFCSGGGVPSPRGKPRSKRSTSNAQLRTFRFGLGRWMLKAECSTVGSRGDPATAGPPPSIRAALHPDGRGDFSAPTGVSAGRPWRPVCPARCGCDQANWQWFVCDGRLGRPS